MLSREAIISFIREANLLEADLRKANLRWADLRKADLRKANLRWANLRWADLRKADLRWAHLRGANLQGADLEGANLREADLREADLRWAHLRGVDLRGVDLEGVDLEGADLRGAKNVPVEARIMTQIVPESGAFDGFKKCNDGAIVRLRIPASAKRSNATGRKCRAERAKVISISNGQEEVKSGHGGVYRVGEYAECHEWCEDRWNECAGGIHFFLTEEEAKRW